MSETNSNNQIFVYLEHYTIQEFRLTISQADGSTVAISDWLLEAKVAEMYEF